MTTPILTMPELGENTLSPRPYQTEAIDAARRELSKHRSTAIILPTGTGKCLATGTPVLMYDGSIKAVEDVKVGDRLMGPDSTPRTVLSTCTGQEMMYRVTPTKGDPYVVNESHILSLKFTQDGSKNAGKIIDISVRDYLRKSYTFRHCTKGYRVGVEFPGLTEELRLEPYFLGVWLGDGVSRTQTVVSTDIEVIEYLAEHAERRSLRHSARTYGGRVTEYTAVGVKRKPNVVRNALRSYDLLNNKHIPTPFKCGPRDVRLQVLAGLIDTDGELSCNGYSLTFKSRRLAEDTAYLARSLGFAAYLKTRICRCTNGRPGHWNYYHKVSISGHCKEIPVRIRAKRARTRLQKKDVLVHGITVESVGLGTYHGFEIDGDRRFLLGDFTVTHNTVLFALAARKTVERGGRVLIVAHREELITQAANVVERTGLYPGVERAENYARSAIDPDVVVASVQTLSRPKRLQTWCPDHFRLIVIDECHHATAASYKRIIKHFASAKLLGVTATPDRADEDDIAGVFDSIAYEMTIWDAMTATPEPYLCPLKVVRCETPVDLRGIKTTGGDFNLGELEDRIGPAIEMLANAIKSKVGDRQTIVFTPDCGSASAMATALQSLGCEADYVWGDSPDRADKVRRYKDGDLRILVNCMLFTEGFDAPHTSAIALCRPTKSRALYSQMVGRGTRLANGKEDCLLVDFAWLTDSMDLVRPADLFDRTTRSDDEGDVLAEMVDAADAPIDLVEASKKAKEEAYRREVVRIKAKARDVKMRWVSYNAIDMAATLGIPWRGASNAVHSRPTERQVQTLAKFGVADAGEMSKRRAGQLLDVMIDRAKKHLATPKQVTWAIKLGVEPSQARAMTFAEASAFLDKSFGKRA